MGVYTSRVSDCEGLVGIVHVMKFTHTTHTHEGSIILGVHIGVHHSGKGVHIGVYKPSH